MESGTSKVMTEVAGDMVFQSVSYLMRIIDKCDFEIRDI